MTVTVILEGLLWLLIMTTMVTVVMISKARIVRVPVVSFVLAITIVTRGQ